VGVEKNTTNDYDDDVNVPLSEKALIGKHSQNA
jgi:hypothetical protein